MRTEQKHSPDWPVIRARWQENSVSVRELARLFSVDEKAIRKRAKAENWQKQVGPQSATADQAETSTETSDDTAAAGGHSLVAAAAAWDLNRISNMSLQVIAKLANELDRVSDNAELLERIVQEETAGEKSPKRRQLLERVLSLPTRLQAARNMASALSIVAAMAPGKKDLARDAARRVGDGGGAWGDLLNPYTTEGEKPWKN